MAASKKTLDRELAELNEELRVIIPGVQILAALLFTVAFTEAFKSFSALERRLYYTGFVSSTVATLMLLAPGVQHRLLWRQPKKEILLRTATVLATLASVVITLALLSTGYLVGEYVYGTGVAAWSIALFGGLIFVLWYAMPLWFRFGTARDPAEETGSEAAE